MAIFVYLENFSCISINVSLYQKYPPSEPCSCEVCKSYCTRPGWWTVEEAEKAIMCGFAGRMMLEVSPGRDFGVLSPAFKGNEGRIAYQEFSKNGCTFHSKGLCDLFGTGHQPLECRFCHHDRKGLGVMCHSEIEQEWTTPQAKRLIVRWGNMVGLWERQGVRVVEKL